MFIEAKDDGGGGDNWTTGALSRAKLQSNHYHQQTNIQFFTGQMPFLSPNQQCQSTAVHKLKNCITLTKSILFRMLRQLILINNTRLLEQLQTLHVLVLNNFMCQTTTLCYNGHFPGEPGLAGVH